MSLKHIFHYLTIDRNHQYSIDDENKLINKFLPDLMSLYRNSEHDLSTFFASYSPEYSQICASILVQFSAFDALPSQLCKINKIMIRNEFDDVELEWSRLKLLIPVYQKQQDENIPSEFCSKTNTCELNLNIFKRIIETYEKNVRFIQQLRDKHLVSTNTIITYVDE